MLLPQKLLAGSQRIDRSALPEPSQERIAALVASLHLLALRIEALREARARPMPQALVDELVADVRAWREKIQQRLEEWSEQPELHSGSGMQDRLATGLKIGSDNHPKSTSRRRSVLASGQW